MLSVLSNRQQMTGVIENFLRNQGFNENDIRIYLDIYQHGQCYASSIAARTKIDRTTVYSALKRLLKKGVVAQTQINEVNAYVATSPDIFVDEVESKMTTLKAERKMASLFAEELRSIRKSNFEKPRIRVYEGEQAIIGLYEETLREGGTQKAFTQISALPEGLKTFFKGKYLQSKKKHGVFSKVITADSAFAVKYRARDEISNRKTKIVSGHPFELHAEIVLFGGSRVAIIDFHEQIYGMVIESNTLYKTIEAVFDFMWSQI